MFRILNPVWISNLDIVRECFPSVIEHIISTTHTPPFVNFMLNKIKISKNDISVSRSVEGSEMGDYSVHERHREVAWIWTIKNREIVEGAITR